MAFPAAATSATNSGGNTTSFDVAIPAVSAGDILIVSVHKDGAGAVGWPSSPAWTVLAEGVTHGDASYGSIAWRRVTGDEGWGSGGTIAVTNATSDAYAAAVAKITGAHDTAAPEVTSAVSTANSHPDCPSLSPTWGSADTLWIATYGWDHIDTHSSYPENYTANQVTSQWANTGGAGIAMSTRELAAATEDPGAAALSGTENWFAITVGIRPAGGTNATATPATIAVATSISAPSVNTGSTVSPSTIAAPTTVPAVTATVGAAINPDAIQAVTSVPAVTVNTGSTVTPAVISIPTTVPAVTVETGGGAAAARILDAITSNEVNSGAGTLDATGLLEGEGLCVLQCGDAGGIVASDLAAPDGSWTERLTHEHVSEVLAKYWTKIQGASPPANFTFTYTDCEDGFGILVAINGGGSSVAYEAISTANTGTGTTITAPAIADVPAGAIVLRFFILYPRGSTGRSIGTPSAGTEIQADLNDDNFNIIVVSYETQASTGSTGTVTATASHSHVWSGVTVAFEIGAGTDATATPATIAVAASIPAPTVNTGSTLTVSTIAASTTIPAPDIVAGTGATATPDTIASSVSIPAPTVSAGAVATPAVISSVTAIPSVTVETTSSAEATPDTIAVVTDVPTPAVSAGGSATVSPATIEAVTAVPSVSLSTGSTATPSAVQAATSLPSVDAHGGVGIEPSTVPVVVTVPAVTVTAERSAIIDVNTIQVPVNMVIPSVVGSLNLWTEVDPTPETTVWTRASG